MTIAFAGGGTLGPVTPLIAVAKRIQETNDPVRIIWFGTPDGPERGVVMQEGFTFYPITVAKLSRHVDAKLMSLPFDYFRAHREARALLKKERPDVVVTAGGFTGVPVIKEAAKLGIPCVMHQLDFVPGLSNKIIAKYCTSVTTSFAYEVAPFSVTSMQIATPTRFQEHELPARQVAANFFGLDALQPIVFVMGGGTGAAALNENIAHHLNKWLSFTQIIHVTGKGKEIKLDSMPTGYVQAPFFDMNEMRHAYAAADVIVTRAGIGALSEISSLSKAAILVPIPHNQQEENALAFHRAKAGLYLKQQQNEFHTLLPAVAKPLVMDRVERERLGRAAHAYFLTDDGHALMDHVLGAISR